MEKLQEELDDVKAAMDKLTAEYQIKVEQSESLRNAHNEQIGKLKEAKLEIEKQAQEINAKEEELLATKQMYEDLQLSFGEKESVLKHLSSTNDKLRADYGEKLQKLEEENRDMAVSLDETSSRSQDQEQKIHMYEKEIEVLKEHLALSKKKCSESEEKARELKEMRQRDDVVSSLEEENEKIKDKLKWKTEHFQHLEEAHEKLQDQFQSSKKEWEQEKSTLIDEISSLQTSLDSQTRISENLQNRLEMCNQALAHEESRRKLLEVQISESKACYENVHSEYQEAKLETESFTAQRDEEIASLRNTLGTKQSFSKEMEFRNGHLEQENQELRECLKELREAQINEAGAASSLPKLRKKLSGLEQVHKECSMNLKAREAEWSSQIERITEELNECRSEVDCKDNRINELQMELESCHSSLLQLKLDYEEMSVLLMVFKSGYADAQSNLSSLKLEMELLKKETDAQIALLMDQDQIALLMEELEQKNAALVKASEEVEEGRMQEHIALLMEQLEQQNSALEKASEMEYALKEDLRKVTDALEAANSELAELANEENEIEFELERRKSLTERLKASLHENHETRKEIEASILAQVETEITLKQDNESLLRSVEEKDKMVNDLKKTIALLEIEVTRRKLDTTTLARTETEEDCKQENDTCEQTVDEEQEKNIRELQQQIASMEQEFMTKELEAAILAHTKEEKALQQAKETLLLAVEEKDQIIENLRKQAMLLEQDDTRPVEVSVLAELAEKQSEIDMLREAREKINAAKVLVELEIEEKNLEIQEKNMMIVKLEEQIDRLQEQVNLQEKSLSHSKQQAEHLKAALEGKKLEMAKVIEQLGNNQRSSEGAIEELATAKGILLEGIMRLSSERSELLEHVGGFCDQISEISDKDTELMGRLEKIVQGIDNRNELVTEPNGVVDIYDSNRENASQTSMFSPRKKTESSSDARSPLKVRNVVC